MGSKYKKCKCQNCHEFFYPDYRNVGRQKYCKKPECRKASKVASQRRWSDKPENRDHFRGSTNVQRVQEWREKNPGYSRKKSTPNPNPKPLQDPCSKNNDLKQSVKAENPHEKSVSHDSPKALQDSCFAQELVIIGLIAHFTGNTLQDSIYNTTLRLQQLGHDILYGTQQQRKGENYGNQTSCLSPTNSHNSKAVQLGGSPSGP